MIYQVDQCELRHGDVIRDEQRMSMLKLRQSDSSSWAMDKLRILLEVSKQLASPDDLDTLLDKILELLFQIMNVDRAAILITNPETGYLETRATRFMPNVPANAQFYSRQITQFVLQHGEGILTTDAQIDKRFDSSKSILQQLIHASMCVLLNSRDEIRTPRKIPSKKYQWATFTEGSFTQLSLTTLQSTLNLRICCWY